MAAHLAALGVVKGVVGKQAVRKAGGVAATTLAHAVGPDLVDKASRGASHGFARLGSRRMAIDHAVQLAGQYSLRTIIEGRRHHVVWKDGSPVAAYPAVDGDLASKPELASMAPHLLLEPNADAD